MILTVDQLHEKLNKLREAFATLMHIVNETEGKDFQKQQAFIRFDEGHMWMQNSILTLQQEAVIKASNTTDQNPIEQ